MSRSLYIVDRHICDHNPMGGGVTCQARPTVSLSWEYVTPHTQRDQRH